VAGGAAPKLIPEAGPSSFGPLRRFFLRPSSSLLSGTSAPLFVAPDNAMPLELDDPKVTPDEGAAEAGPNWNPEGGLDVGGLTPKENFPVCGALEASSVFDSF